MSTRKRKPVITEHERSSAQAYLDGVAMRTKVAKELVGARTAFAAALREQEQGRELYMRGTRALLAAGELARPDGVPRDLFQREVKGMRQRGRMQRRAGMAMQVRGRADARAATKRIDALGKEWRRVDVLVKLNVGAKPDYGLGGLLD